MRSPSNNSKTTHRTLTVFGAILLALPVTFAQQPQLGPDPGGPALDPQQQQTAPLLSPEQLNNLVAPVALYPDPLLSQVLSASTYPLEIVEAQQWLGQNRSLRGTQLVEAAKQQNWDPSVQALVVFPDALSLLANDVRWTTDLGNAFLSQQGDVMSAVQRMRGRARSSGRLATTQQQVVNTEYQDGEQAIQIMPADPEVIYVPIYNPTYVWGPPAWGYYPDLWYPSGYGFGFGFSPGFRMGFYFSNWGGWGGWGWGCGWFGGHRSLYVNSGFFNRYGFRGYGGGGFGGRGYGGNGYYAGRGSGGFGGGGGRAAWSHDPGHRMGVPYPNHNLASRFNGGNGERMNSGRFNSGARTSSGYYRGGGEGRSQSTGGGWRSFGNTNQSQSGFRQSAPSAFGNGGGGQWNNGGRSNYRQSAPSEQRQQQRFQSPQQSFGRSSFQSGYAAPQHQQQQQQQFRGGGGGYSAPRSYGAPSSFGGGGSSRSYGAPSRSYSAPSYSPPQRSSPAPRASGGGGSGFSGGGRSGGGSGSAPSHSGGGGRGNHR